ncbi:protein involved in polysaccharide export with SLBB domain [Arcticibacter tournemirensis]|uniref:Capsule biosynthesis protein n=1 Tax=Arcticibacter tournemirensis TaxID=699437 RepID=A0A5M9HCK5_9SPHI|nr:SLBB domain-containing protein [Arcticibacter tournemirensis]KAA8484652.1 capsule biosynthesis protein [Arcticibacter tournemirensis]TQM47057.1 protein involved in polysaccharide export with SLBB domain [Arcticibacter tournemirensis]
MRPIKHIRVLVILTTLFFALSVSAQTNQNFSNIRVDELSDTQIRQFIAQVEATGLSEAQLEQVAQARGMSPVEIQKLRQRVDRLKATEKQNNGSQGLKNSGNNRQAQSGREYNFEPASADSVQASGASAAEKALSELRSKIFGADLFRNRQLTFEPNLRLATPRNYQIGPDDELLIDIYGYSEASYQLKVSPEGTINIPYIGVIPVSGMTIEQATSRIKSRLSTIYSGLKSGNTSVSIAIGNIRSIKVILTGEVVKPGTYSLPSLATVFNALYSSGGPTENGSFRQIELIRAGKRIATLDIYDFLLNGEFKNNYRLQDQDVIRVPTYHTRTEITGEVKRPGIFEMKSGEKLADLLRFAGGFNERAYQARVKVLKNTETERRIDDVTSDAFASYNPSSGDKYFVDQILDRFENRVKIEGAVFRPGQFELEPGLTVKQLIERAEGLREDAFRNRAYITRLKDDLQTELVSFDIAKVLSGEAADIPLKREDVITISSIFDLKEEYNVRVEGEVLKPGRLNFAEGMTLEDAIIQAGGLREGATPKRVEISRRIKNSDVLSESARTAQVFQVDINQNLKSATAGFVLQPFDIVVVRPSSGYSVQQQVKVQGEVLYPGIYTITHKDERISDLLKRTGGFTAYAYVEGASLQRPGAKVKDSTDVEKKMEFDRMKQFQRLQQKVSDTLKIEEEAAIRNDYVGINLPRILKKPGGKDDLFLEEGDILNIPRQLQTVKVSGEVLSPVTVVYSRGKGFKQYISNAGGFSDRAKKKSAYIIYANGSVESAGKFLFFNNYPVVKPGAEIFVPKKPEARRMSTGELVGITSGLASLAAIIVALFR